MNSSYGHKDWDFFIAHAHSDTPAAEQLHSMLKVYGTVFLDTKSLNLGDDWDEAIKDALKHSKVIVLLIPSNAKREYYERDEISLALSLSLDDPDGIRIVQVYTGAPSIGEVPYGLRAMPSISLPETGIENVAQQVGRLAGDLKARESRFQSAMTLWGHEPSLRKQRALNRPARVFISYSHRDQRFADELHRHLIPLKREGLIDVWHDREIGVGEGWRGSVDAWLTSADVVLLLISPDYLSSEYCYDLEMKTALDRHSSGESHVVPIILRSCDWTSSPFAKLQVLPHDGMPVTRHDDRNKAWEETIKVLVDIVYGLDIQLSGRDKEDYIYDIFVSYRRLSKEWVRWTKQNFVDPLEALLQPRLPKVSIYTNLSIETDASWPIELARNLARSKLMVAILSRAYFDSDSCRLELGLMFKREQLTGFRTLRNPSHLIIPAIIDNGDSFPSKVQAMQGAPMHEFANPYIVIGSRKQQRLTAVIRQKICPAIESALLNVPPFDPKWEHVSHEEVRDMFHIEIRNKMTMPSLNLP